MARTNEQVHAAISKVLADADRWSPARHQDGSVREGAAVAEVTDLVDLSAWPPGTRLIVRREPLHPGAQQSLFPSLAYRYGGHYTDATGDAVSLDVDMRAHARRGGQHLPPAGLRLRALSFTDLDAIRAWLALVCFADALVRWFQLLCCTGRWAGATPKSLRWALWHSPARVVRKAGQVVVRLLDGWPAAEVLLGAYRRIAPARLRVLDGRPGRPSRRPARPDRGNGVPENRW